MGDMSDAATDKPASPETIKKAGVRAIMITAFLRARDRAEQQIREHMENLNGDLELKRETERALGNDNERVQSIVKG